MKTGIESVFSAIDDSVDAKKLPEVGSRVDGYVLARRYLDWLGYIRKSNKNPLMDLQLQGALNRFQIDIGREPTGDLDLYTFSTLNQLVAFESHSFQRIQVRRLPTTSGALQRARRLRLTAYGLIDRRKRFRSSLVDTALQDFVMLLVAMRIPGANKAMTEREIDRFLFDLDIVSQNIKGTKISINFTLPDKTKPSKRKYYTEKFGIFVRHIAGIELWLAGYDLDIKDITNEELSLSKPLRAYWLDSPKSKRPSAKARSKVSGYFFDCVNSIALNFSESEVENINGELLISLKDSSFRKKVEKKSKNIVGRLWDGMKRSARWLLSFFRKVKKGISQLANNVARWLVTSARKIYSGVVSLLKAIQIGFKYLLDDKAIRGAKEHLLIDRKYDFDFNIFVNVGGELETKLLISAKYLQAAKLFSVGLEAITFVSRAFKSLVAAGSAAVWFVLYWALVKANSEYTELKKLINECKKELGKWEELNSRAVNY